MVVWLPLAEIVDSDPTIVVPFETNVVPFEEIVVPFEEIVDSEAFDANDDEVEVDPFPDTAPVVLFDVDRIVKVMTEVPLLVVLTAIVEFSDTFDTNGITVILPGVVPFDPPVVSETFAKL